MKFIRTSVFEVIPMTIKDYLAGGHGCAGFMQNKDDDVDYGSREWLFAQRQNRTIYAVDRIDETTVADSHSSAHSVALGGDRE